MFIKEKTKDKVEHMFVLTTTGFRFEKENWIRFIKEKKITKVILIRLVKKAGPVQWHRPQEEVYHDLEQITQYSDREREDLRKAIDTVNSLLNLLKQMYMEFEYHELLETEPELKRTAYISKVIAGQSESGIIDIARGERIMVASFFKVAQYFPEKITEFGMSNFTSNEFVPILTTFMNPDPDHRQTATFKELLSVFIPKKTKDYSTIPGKVKIQSNDVEKIITQLKPSHVKNRLQKLALKQPGNPNLLLATDDPIDKRKIWYQLSDYGLFVLYINFLRSSEIDTSEKLENWVEYLTNIFSDIQFTNFNNITVFNPFPNL